MKPKSPLYLMRTFPAELNWSEDHQRRTTAFPLTGWPRRRTKAMVDHKGRVTDHLGPEWVAINHKRRLTRHRVRFIKLLPAYKDEPLRNHPRRKTIRVRSWVHIRQATGPTLPGVRGTDGFRYGRIVGGRWRPDVAKRGS